MRMMFSELLHNFSILIDNYIMRTLARKRFTHTFTDCTIANDDHMTSDMR